MRPNFVTLFVLFVSIFALCENAFSSASSETTGVLARELLDKALPFDGPNCVNAALIAGGLTNVVTHMAPTYAERNLIPNCFRESAIGAGKVGVIFRGESIWHMFFVQSNDGMAFTKNGLSADANYQIQPMQQIIDYYWTPDSRLTFYSYAPQPSCPLSAFEALIKTDKELEQVAHDLNARAKSMDWNEEYPRDIYLHIQKKIDQLRARSNQESELAVEMLQTYLASPLFAKARDADFQSRKIHSISDATGLAPQVVRDRLNAVDKAEIQLRQLAIEAGSDSEHSQFAESFFASVLKKGVVQLGYWPQNADQTYLLTLFLVVPMDHTQAGPEMRHRLSEEIERLSPFQVQHGDIILRKRKKSGPLEIVVNGAAYQIFSISLTDR